MIRSLMDPFVRIARKSYLYIRRHSVFLLMDLLAFVLAYFAAVLFRRSLRIGIYRPDLIIKYGVIAALVYMVVEFATRNLNGILFRSFGREIGSLLAQMGVSWAFFTVILYLHKEAHEFSRAIYLIAFVFCFFFILLVRTLLKTLVRYSRLHEKNAPCLLVVCEASRAQMVLSRVLPGSFENYYQIGGVVLNRKGEPDYHDWYPHKVGLEHLDDFLKSMQVQDAYVELEDPAEEKQAIQRILAAGVTVHRSLGESDFNYLSQRIDHISSVSVITIEDSGISRASRVDQFLRKFHRKNK